MGKGAEEAELPDSTRAQAVMASQLFDLTDPANSMALDTYAQEVAGFVPPARDARAETIGDAFGEPNTAEDLQYADNMFQDSDGNLKDVDGDAGARAKAKLGGPGASALGVGAALQRHGNELVAGRADGGTKASQRARQVQAVSALAARGVGREAQAAESMAQAAHRETTSALADAADTNAAHNAGVRAAQGLGYSALGYHTQRTATNQANALSIAQSTNANWGR